MAPFISHLRVDGLNYRQQVRAIFGRKGWHYELTEEQAARTAAALRQLWKRRG